MLSMRNLLLTLLTVRTISVGQLQCKPLLYLYLYLFIAKYSTPSNERLLRYVSDSDSDFLYSLCFVSSRLGRINNLFKSWHKVYMYVIMWITSNCPNIFSPWSFFQSTCLPNFNCNIIDYFSEFVKKMFIYFFSIASTFTLFYRTTLSLPNKLRLSSSLSTFKKHLKSLFSTAFTWQYHSSPAPLYLHGIMTLCKFYYYYYYLLLSTADAFRNPDSLLQQPIVKQLRDYTQLIPQLQSLNGETNINPQYISTPVRSKLIRPYVKVPHDRILQRV